MLRDDVIYQAGENDGRLAHAFLFHFGMAGLSRTRAAGITRYIEFWCQQNCRGGWQIIEKEQTVKVSFDRGLDVVIFQLSDEYSVFAQRESVLQRPHSVS